MYSNGVRSSTEVPSRNQADAKESEDIPEPTLAGDKEEFKHGQDWMEIKVEDRNLPNADEAEGLNQPSSGRIPRNGFFSPHDGPPENETPTSTNSVEEAPPQPLEEDDPGEASSAPQSPEPQGGRSPASTNGPAPPNHERSESSLSVATNGTRRSSTISSMVFVVTALENISGSKEARKRKGLGDSVQAALSAIKSEASPSPEIIFEPLRLATETTSIPLTTTALDCIGKLITYSYFSIPAVVPTGSSSLEQPQVPLIERAIDTICDCFQDEATPAEVQLQIVKSLLAAVLNDKIIVHGAGLLKAVRQIYNIFLLSKSGPNQQVAQGTLSQMVGTVFERVKNRLALKEARLNLTKTASERGTANGSQVDLTGSNGASDVIENDTGVDPEASSEAASILTADPSVSKDPGEKLTLQSFENAKNFDDTRIGDNAPTMVTRATTSPTTLRTSSGRQPVPVHTSDEHSDPGLNDEEEEDEIYVKDAFLVFRSMCRLSTKILPQEQLKDLRSQNMRSKLISLAIIRTLLNNNMEVFTSPLVTIRSSVNNEPTSFGQAINQYLRLAVSRNGASSIRQVFETSCEIFWLMLKDMRVMLKVPKNRDCAISRTLITHFAARD